MYIFLTVHYASVVMMASFCIFETDFVLQVVL